MEVTIEHRPYLKGHLEIHTTRDPAGGTVREAFTFASLESVLGIPLTTLEGRYTRSRAKIHKVNLRTGAGRPARGFPLEMLDQIIAAMTQADSRFTPANLDPNKNPGASTLEPEMRNGEAYFTVQALADHYGVTAPTVRSRIKSAGLDARMVPVGSGRQGGRPRKAFHQRDLPDVHLALTGGVTFATEEATRGAHHAYDMAAVGREVDEAVAPAADDNPILYALRAAGMASGSNPAERSGGNNEWDDLIEEINRIAPANADAAVALPVRVAVGRDTSEVHPSGFEQFTTEAQWLAEVNRTARDHITDRYTPDLAALNGAQLERLNGQGIEIGMRTSAGELEEYVMGSRARVREHLRPYEDLLVEKVDEHFPEGSDDCDIVAAYALRRAMFRVPVYLGQVPVMALDSRVLRYGNTAIWKALCSKPVDASTPTKRDLELSEIRSRVTESTAFIEKFQVYDRELYLAVATIDGRVGVFGTHHPTKNGHLWVPEHIIPTFRNT